MVVIANSRDRRDWLIVGPGFDGSVAALQPAERLAVRITPERTALDTCPLGAPDDSDGDEILSERSGACLHKDRRTHTAAPTAHDGVRTLHCR